MYNTIVNEKTKLAVDIPKVFWKYYHYNHAIEIITQAFSEE